MNPLLAKKKGNEMKQLLKAEQLKKKDINTLNQRDRVRMMKEAKHAKEFELMKQAAADNVQSQRQAKAMM